MNSMMALRDAIRAKLDQRMMDNMRTIGSGQAKDYAEYKSKTGRIQGLNDAKSVVDEMFTALLNEEND